MSSRNNILIVALLGVILVLMFIMYRDGKKHAERATERLIIEEKNVLLEIRVDSLKVEVNNSRIRNNQLRIKKQRIKYIYREIKTTIDTISIGGLDDRLLANGFHPLLPCE